MLQEIAGGGSEVRAGVRIGLEQLVRLVVADVSELEGRSAMAVPVGSATFHLCTIELRKFGATPRNDTGAGRSNTLIG